MDLPAPVSPVRTASPRANSISSRSIRTMSRIDRRASMRGNIPDQVPRNQNAIPSPFKHNRFRKKDYALTDHALPIPSALKALEIQEPLFSLGSTPPDFTRL